MKLKALTVSGFKSFADKTGFDFHDGVTCIVGPNGCGKSNVVDAVKWVLGEQSAKSLRGGEMMDVIFNGTAQRRASGFAEVALAFEDAAGVLGQGAPPSADGVVTVSRRLYRSGESEYLINNVAARLKDIREMFLDTGVGTDAYSLIEQGKVDTFLQASMEDRRAVFDEAAGISRYKVRRREALRRLERVEQNLLRLTDVLGEVQKRLRSIKYQAGKARSHQEYTTRLRELKSLFSLAEYHRLGGQRRGLQQQADALGDALSQLSAQIDRLETSRTACETEMGDLERRAHELDTRIAELTSQIASCQQRAEMLTTRAAELTDGILADASRSEQLEARVEANAGELQAQRRRIQELSVQLAELARQDESLRGEQAEGHTRVESLRQELEDEKNGTIDLLRRTAQLHNEVQVHGLRRENLSTQRQRLVGRADELAKTLEGLLIRRADIQAKTEDIQLLVSDTQRRLDQAHEQQRQLETESTQLTGELSTAQQQHSALVSRQTLLEEMQRRLEGVGEGVRKVLAARERVPFVRGMLGDFLETDVAHAAVIETAMGETEQRLLADRLEDVLNASETLREILGGAGGVEVLALDQLQPAAERTPPAPQDYPGVVARAMDLVRCDPTVAPAVEQVLGRTLIVRSLADAAVIFRTGRGWRFVTTGGDVLEADGRIRIGALAGEMGLIWRKSELADLQRRRSASGQQIDQTQLRIQDLQQRRRHNEEVIASLRTAIYEAQTERVECETLCEQLDQQMAELKRNQPLLSEEVRQLAEEIESAVHHEHEAQERAAEMETLRTQREARVAELNERLAEAEKRQQELSAQITAAQVALAEARQKQAGWEEVAERLVRAGEAMAQELAAVRACIEQARQRKGEAEAGSADARVQMEERLKAKSAVEAEVRENDESRASLQQRMEDIRAQLAADRKRHEETSAQLGNLRVQLSEVEVRVENLIARTNEELGIDLPAAYAAHTQPRPEGEPPKPPLDESRDWQAVQQEIAELRGKIERLGNVNLDAIAEQDELQQREKFLNDQLEDVRSSQRQLHELIRRLNAESRKRFEESFETVRGLFNELFRKLFGGGKADIVLTNPEDMLESPIEVVARPPGKELRSITLMSGGEKTMTALALLFSFFKARPSPFCLLDEVDAALDEANTGRFALLVREFLATSQFIIISHSKRTIAMADQIYGVTMQEAGVSRKISVRFEDAGRLVETAQPQPAPA